MVHGFKSSVWIELQSSSNPCLCPILCLFGWLFVRFLIVLIDQWRISSTKLFLIIICTTQIPTRLDRRLSSPTEQQLQTANTKLTTISTQTKATSDGHVQTRDIEQPSHRQRTHHHHHHHHHQGRQQLIPGSAVLNEDCSEEERERVRERGGQSRTPGRRH